MLMYSSAKKDTAIEAVDEPLGENLVCEGCQQRWRDGHVQQDVQWGGKIWVNSAPPFQSWAKIPMHPSGSIADLCLSQTIAWLLPSVALAEAQNHPWGASCKVSDVSLGVCLGPVFLAFCHTCNHVSF